MICSGTLTYRLVDDPVSMGIVVDSEVVSTNEFLLVSQSCEPTKYYVLHQDLVREEIHYCTYQFCFMHYNVQNTYMYPSVCTHAQLLAKYANDYPHELYAPVSQLFFI